MSGAELQPAVDRPAKKNKRRTAPTNCLCSTFALADLVTLSACDTGIGKVEGEEGITNLAEAFLVSGGRAVVASLWSADDTFTSDLMKRFSTHLAQGEDKATALRDAKVDLLTKYGDHVSPYYWGAFVLIGDGGSPIPLN